jgi:hypothetical protein
MLAEIHGWFTEGFDTADLKDAKALQDQFFRKGGDHTLLEELGPMCVALNAERVAATWLKKTFR